MGFGTLTVTNAGVALQAKVLAGATLVFTKARAGSGALSAGQDPKTMTALVSVKQDISISSVTASVPNQLTARIDFNNRALATGYMWREIGLFALDPVAGEILYAYCNAGDEGTYMPAGVDGFAEQIVDLITVISNVQEITVHLDNTGVTPVWDDLRINGIIPCVGTGTNAITANNANITGYVDGMKITLDMGTSANSGAATININGIGAKAAVKQLANGSTGALTGGETAGITEWQYKASLSAFILLSDGPATKALQDGKLDKNGGTMTGPLVLYGAPSADMQAANKAYVDSLLAANDAMVFKGAISASSNPNYPAADCGHVYRISTAGKIGGASGVNVEVGDAAMCTVDGSAAGTQAAVGGNWIIVQANVDGAVIGPASSVNDHIPTLNGTNGKVIKDSGIGIGQVPLRTTADMTLYVNTSTGSDTTGDGSAGAPYRTIGMATAQLAALSAVNHAVNINVADGTYNEVVSISGLTGAGSITFTGNASTPANVVVTQFNVSNCTIQVSVNGFTASTTTATAVLFTNNSRIVVSNCRCTASSASFSGFSFQYCQYGGIQSCVASNRANGIICLGGRVYSLNNTGSGNTTGITASSAGYIGKNGTQPAGTTAQQVDPGSQIV